MKLSPLKPIFNPERSRGVIRTGAQLSGTYTLDVTINQAAGQSDPYNGIPPAINLLVGPKFDVAFSTPVTGFVVSSDVAFGGTAAPVAVRQFSASNPNWVVQPYILTAPGTVTASIPAGVATSTTRPGVPNQASTSADNIVAYNPRLVCRGSVTPLGGAVTQSMAFGNGHVFLTASNNIFHSINVSDPDHPTVAQSFALSGATSTRACAVSGNYAYVVSSQQLRVIDITNPASMSVVGTVTNSGIHDRVLYDSGFCYTSERVSNLFRVIDVSTPSAPSVVGSVDLGTELGGGGLAKIGNIVLVVCDNKLYAVNVSTPSAPTSVGSVVGPSFSGGAGFPCVVLGNYAYVRTDVFDVSTPSSPSALGLWTGTLGIASPMFTAYAGEPVTASITTVGGVGTFMSVALLNVSDPVNLAFSGISPAATTPSASAMSNVVIDGDFIYAADAFGNMRVFEVVA